MVAIAPQTDIILLQVPLQLNQEHQLNFTNATAQYNYFNSLPKLTEYNATYMRKGGVIRYEANFEDLVGYNYVMYRNEAYGERWFYAFITDMEYVGDNMTNIYIKTDVWQTWQFSLIWKDTFIEREHTNDDRAGSNTVPENLEFGEPVVDGSVTNINYGNTTEANVSWICIAVTTLIEGFNPDIRSWNLGGMNGGVYNGLKYLFVLGADDASDIIKEYDRQSKADAIVSIFQVPLSILSAEGNMSITNHTITSTGANVTIGTVNNNYRPLTIGNASLSRNTALNGYTPVNNKCLTYPYHYLYVTNNGGEDVTFKWEDFSGNASFTVDAIVTPSMSIKCYPLNYKNVTNQDNYPYSLSGQKLPICAWTSDYYTNWLTQNGANTVIQAGASVLSAGVGMVSTIASGNPFGLMTGTASMISTISNTLQQVREAKLVPDQAKGNVNTGDVNFANNKVGFSFYKMSIKAEYARIVDNYFSMFGYATHRVKKPNITGRRNWNYVKTVGCYIQTNAPQEDVQELEEMFNRGITIWHNPATFMDYSQSNPIV